LAGDIAALFRFCLLGIFSATQLFCAGCWRGTSTSVAGTVFAYLLAHRCSCWPCGTGRVASPDSRNSWMVRRASLHSLRSGERVFMARRVRRVCRAFLAASGRHNMAWRYRDAGPLWRRRHSWASSFSCRASHFFYSRSPCSMARVSTFSASSRLSGSSFSFSHISVSRCCAGGRAVATKCYSRIAMLAGGSRRFSLLYLWRSGSATCGVDGGPRLGKRARRDPFERATIAYRQQRTRRWRHSARDALRGLQAAELGLCKHR